MTVQIIYLRFFFLKEKKYIFCLYFYFILFLVVALTTLPELHDLGTEEMRPVSWLLAWDTASSPPALSLQQQKWGQVQQLWLDHQRWDFLAVSVSGNWTCLGGLLAAVTEQHGAPCIHTAKQSSLITWCLRPRLIFKPQPEILGSLSCSGPEL